MNKKLNLIATFVFIIGLLAPATAHAGGFIENTINWFGASFGATIGHKMADGVSHHVTEMIPNNLKKPLIIAGVVGIIACIVYATSKESKQTRKKERSVRKLIIS